MEEFTLKLLIAIAVVQGVYSSGVLTRDSRNIKNDTEACDVGEMECPESVVGSGSGSGGGVVVCIPLSSLCDGIQDCPDGTDEDNCPVLISLEQPSYTVREDITDGKGFGLLICAVVQEQINQNVTVVLEVLASQSNTATEEDDFVATKQLLTFSPNSNTRQCGCTQIINDVINETTEVFTARLQGSNGEELQGTTTATVTILDDDNGSCCVPILAVEELMQNLLIRSSDCMMFPTLPPTTDPPTLPPRP